jgi:hypothetical protein
VDHPVLAPGGEQRVATAGTLAVEVDDDLAVLPLDDLVGALVPDEHPPGAVLATRDLAVEAQVLERVVLGAHCQVVALGGQRHPLGQRPRRQRALVLEPEVPVQAGGVVLLDHEAVPGRRPFAAERLGRLRRVALGAVLA